MHPKMCDSGDLQKFASKSANSRAAQEIFLLPCYVTFQCLGRQALSGLVQCGRTKRQWHCAELASNDQALVYLHIKNN